MIGDDYIIDRHKLKSSLNRWKFLALTELLTKCDKFATITEE